MCELYELTDAPSGQSLPERIQDDWQIFSFNEENRIREFLISAGLDDELTRSDARVRLKAVGGDGGDHVASWTQFSEELRTANRYFPTTALNFQVLETVLAQTAIDVSNDAELYRARSSDSVVAHSAAAMGAPPAHLARAGRANPVGIPYLYLAFDRETCLDEMRPVIHSLMSVGKFTLTRSVRVMNLFEIPPLDYFAIREIEDFGEQAQRLAYHRYLVELGKLLSRPVRNSDSQTDYIPTQFLCELAKSLGFDGVMYSSAVRSNGRNIVLFDIGAAVCDQVQLVSAKSVTALWETLAQDS